MNGPISVRGLGPNLLGICTIRGLQDQTGRGTTSLVWSKTALLASICKTDRPGLSILHNIFALYQTQV